MKEQHGGMEAHTPARANWNARLKKR